MNLLKRNDIVTAPEIELNLLEPITPYVVCVGTLNRARGTFGAMVVQSLIPVACVLGPDSV